MKKIIGPLAGGVITLIGLILLVAWWYEFVFLVRGVLPVLLITGGVIGIISGFSEMRDTAKNKF
ncbi:MAG: hypothetical protein PHH49_05585 [Candidatus Omnitrophica bacterium]|nr:hypothetical protein [Candidatus Omnitrophota bacterium]MDD5488414.1 hypothetical protein [Candidatus Omnitrophota bacterium]